MATPRKSRMRTVSHDAWHTCCQAALVLLKCRVCLVELSQDGISSQLGDLLCLGKSYRVSTLRSSVHQSLSGSIGSIEDRSTSNYGSKVLLRKHKAKSLNVCLGALGAPSTKCVTGIAMLV